MPRTAAGAGACLPFAVAATCVPVEDASAFEARRAPRRATVRSSQDR